jgi:hypothetical protein
VVVEESGAACKALEEVGELELDVGRRYRIDMTLVSTCCAGLHVIGRGQLNICIIAPPPPAAHQRCIGHGLFASSAVLRGWPASSSFMAARLSIGVEARRI